MKHQKTKTSYRKFTGSFSSLVISATYVLCGVPTGFRTTEKTSQIKLNHIKTYHNITQIELNRNLNLSKLASLQEIYRIFQ